MEDACRSPSAPSRIMEDVAQTLLEVRSSPCRSSIRKMRLVGIITVDGFSWTPWRRRPPRISKRWRPCCRPTNPIQNSVFETFKSPHPVAPPPDGLGDLHRPDHREIRGRLGACAYPDRLYPHADGYRRKLGGSQASVTRSSAISVDEIGFPTSSALHLEGDPRGGVLCVAVRLARRTLSSCWWIR